MENKYFQAVAVFILIINLFQIKCKQNLNRTLSWQTEKKEAFQIAEKENKKIILFFQKTNCRECKELERVFILAEKLNLSQNSFVFLLIKEGQPDFEEFLSDDRYSFLVNKEFFFVISNFSEEILFETQDFNLLKDFIGNFKK
ncbi:MAG: thioredoxin family protein [Leptospiraceae bacterium]|nr:thioredoxin family protein [Leptospiraceae bacterium]MCK6380834.1 thioredoxin family protein [Leptospiraceae bacterium]NUM42863.1 thioredoxin family protein [Leptospiraceae bacterium]